MSKGVEIQKTVPVIAILNQSTTYPYSITGGRSGNGVAIDNTGTLALTVELSGDNFETISIPVGIDQMYYGDFFKFKTIDVTGGDEYTIEVRSF